MIAPKTLLRIHGLMMFATVVATYQGALHGLPWLGLAVFSLCLLLALPLFGEIALRLKLILLGAIPGVLLDTVLIATGVYVPSPHTRFLLPSPLCPEWILALWLNYGVALYYYRLRPATVRQGVIGSSVLALIVYGNAGRQGLIAMPNLFVGLGIVCLLWSVLILSFGRLARKVSPEVTSGPDPEKEKTKP